MNVIELTHTIQGDMPVYPGTEKPVLTTACTIGVEFVKILFVDFLN